MSALGEFELIQEFFTRDPIPARGTSVAVGDDCALVRVEPSTDLAITVDTLVSGVHFLPDTDPHLLGYKALAVNLSDLAAMAAEPRWCTLALTLPSVEREWLKAFSAGFFELAEKYQIELIGGDTTRGPLAITIQAMGQCPSGMALRRSGARPGDLIYVSGPIGSAGFGLKMQQGEIKSDSACMRALLKPEPQLELAIALRGIASACIDVSDGLLSDLGHILTSSEVGGEIQINQIPFDPFVEAYLKQSADYHFALTAGDDYELCFTVPPEMKERLTERTKTLGLEIYEVGRITSQRGLDVRFIDGTVMPPPKHSGFQHFENH